MFSVLQVLIQPRGCVVLRHRIIKIAEEKIRTSLIGDIPTQYTPQRDEAIIGTSVLHNI